MEVKGIIKGKVVDKVVGKSGKVFLKVYDGKSLVSVFQNSINTFDDVVLDDVIELPVRVVSKDCYCEVL